MNHMLKVSFFKKDLLQHFTLMWLWEKKEKKKAESSLGMLWLYPQWCFTEKCLYMQIQADGGKQSLRLFQGI